MNNIPSKIFLNISGVNIDEEYDFKEMEEVTWCADRINETDVAYIRERFPAAKKYSLSIEEKLDFIDMFLLVQEYYLKGKQGKDCTKSRVYINEIKKELLANAPKDE